MKKLLLQPLRFILILSLLLTTFSSKASHVIGSEITYQCTGTPNSYLVNVKLYKDCNGVQLCANCPTSISPACNITVFIKGMASPTGSGLPTSPCSGVSFGSQVLSVVTGVSGFDVVQLCSTVKTICNNCGTRTPGTYTPGVEVYTFQGNVNLSALPASCCLVSIGYGSCCRNTAIPTLANPGSLSFYSDAIINRCAAPCNSSHNPTSMANESEIVVSSGKDVILNFGTSDPDGDSLSYHRGRVLTAAGTGAPYVSPYSDSVPFPYLGAPAQSPPFAAPSGISMDVYNGNYRFRPMGSFVAPIVVEIKQWKTIGGVPTLMGITRKEHHFYSQLGQTNNAPQILVYNDLNIQTPNNGPYSIYDSVCAGQTYCRTFVAKDIDIADTTDLTWNLPNNIYNYGGAFTRSFNPSTRAINGPRQDSVKFCWTIPSSAPIARPYYLTVTAKDRSCPLNGKTLINIGIVVSPAPNARINTDALSAMTYKVKYTKLNAVYNNPALTQWQIETAPKSNVFSTITADSLPNFTFTNVGMHKIRLLLKGNCTNPIVITDSVLVTTFNLTLVEAKNIGCKNDSSGRIIVNATGGWPPYQYRIQSGSYISPYGTKDTFSNLPAKTYTVFVEDSLNNVLFWGNVSLTVTLTQPSNALSLNIISSKRPTCFGDSNGIVTVGASNNTGPFQVKIGSDPYQSSPVFANLKSKTHLFTIQDSLGCLATQNFNLPQPTTIFLGISVKSNVFCKGDSSGYILLGSGGGILPYKYRINGSPLQTNNYFDNLKVGSKLIEIIDSIGCLKSLNTTITEPAEKMTLSVLSKTLITCTTPNASVTLVATNGTSPYNYGRLGGPVPVASPVVGNLTAGIYTFIATDVNLCQATIIDTIKSISPLLLSLSKKDINCNGNLNGSITCASTGGIAPYQYKLNTGAFGSNNVFNNLAAGTYSMTVKDSTGCLKTEQVSIVEPAKINSSIVGTNTACATINTGTAEVFVSGGKLPYTYSWNTSPIQNTAKASLLPAGKALVTITDSNACTKKDSVVIGTNTLFNDEQICAVSVDSVTNQNLIVWNKTPNKGTAAFQIWVAPNSTAIPTLLTTVPFNDNSSFLDNISAPLPSSQAYYYSLKVVDSCANTSSLSFTHKPLSLSSNQIANRVNLNWIPYAGGVNINQYKVHRANNNGAYSIIATVAYGTNNYVDSLGGSGTKHYIVEGVYAPACFTNFKVFSNRVSIFASGLQVASLGSNSYLIYPNPSNGKISIKKQPNSENIKKIEVTNLLGSVLFLSENEKPVAEQNIDLSQLAAGTYHLVITNENGLKQIQQIVLQK